MRIAVSLLRLLLARVAITLLLDNNITHAVLDATTAALTAPSPATPFAHFAVHILGILIIIVLAIASSFGLGEEADK